MALAYLLDPSFQFVNENGRPLVGGKISVYYHNSHLPYVTKADFDGTNNPFEVPLNSKGMAVIIADDSNAYDVFCYDALGTLFWSRENVTIGAGGGGGGGAESKLEIFNCTEPDWPNPTEMFDSYNGGKDVVIVRQSFSGVNYSVWSLESVVKDSGLIKNYTLEFQNEEGATSANHKTNRVSFYSSDYENWTITEKTFYYPERSTIAPNWSSLDVSNYKKGTLVYRAGVLYICKTDTPSSSWVASEWQETNIASEVEKGELKIFTCTEPDWPEPSLMYSAFESGQDIAIVRQSFSGVIYSVWRLATTIKDVGSPKNYTLEFQNDEGSETANRKTNRVKFYSTDKENWTTTETNFVYPERATIAPNWSSLDVSNYKKGTLVYRAGVLYRCETDTPSSSWVAAEWTQTEIAAEIGGDSNIDTDFSRPVFVQQLTTNDNDLNYDARLDNLLYKLPSGYKKVRGVYNISNATSHPIDTGISTDDGIDIEFIVAFFINTWVQYGQIVGNSYIDNDSHYFSVSCGNSSGRINCFVNTNYNSVPNATFQNGSAICLRQTGSTRIAKDCYYPFNSYLASGTTGDANTSNIKMFTSPLVTIYSLYIKKGGVVVRDFIPCVRLSDNVAGFYDKISKAFFTNDDPSILGASYP